MPKRSRPYREAYLKRLEDHEYAELFLAACALEPEECRAALVALATRDIAEAKKNKEKHGTTH